MSSAVVSAALARGGAAARRSLEQAPSLDRLAAGHHHLLQRGLLRQDGREAVIERVGDDERAGAAVAQHEIVIRGGQQRVDRDRNDAGLDRAQEERREIHGVEKTEQHALFRLDTEAAQSVGGTVDPLGKLGIGEGGAIVAKGGLGAAPGLEVALDEIDGSVVVARQDDLRRRARRAIGVHP